MSRLIRDATTGDAAAIAEIYAPIVADTAISFEFDPPGAEEMAARIVATQATNPWLVMVDDGELAGYAYATAFRARPAYAQSRETSVYVSPAHRRSGVARALMERILDVLADQGVRTVIAGVTLPNPHSVALHESLGFLPVGVFHSVGRKFDTWHDVGFWEKSLEDRRPRV